MRKKCFVQTKNYIFYFFPKIYIVGWTERTQNKFCYILKITRGLSWRILRPDFGLLECGRSVSVNNVGVQSAHNSVVSSHQECVLHQVPQSCQSGLGFLRFHCWILSTFFRMIWEFIWSTGYIHIFIFRPHNLFPQSIVPFASQFLLAMRPRYSKSWANF